MREPNYLRLRGKNGEVVTVSLRSGKAYAETPQPKRRDEARIQRRRESTEKLMRQLEEERDSTKDGCFGVLLALVMGAGAMAGFIGGLVG